MAQKDTPEAVLEQYRRFHQVMEQALATNDPSDIRRVATGVIAQALEATVADQQRKGIVRRGHTAINPTVRLLGDRAMVTDCLVTPGFTAFRSDSGRRTAPPPHPLRQRIRALLTKEDGVWKVSETNTPGEAPC